MNNLKIGLALGSGGARGLAHIGVIKALERAGVKIDFIAGSSMGAWVGAWYARHLNIGQVEKFALAMDWKQVADLLLDLDFRGGLVGGEKMEKLVRAHLGDMKFSDLKIPLSVVTSDLYSGEKVALDKGDVVRAVRASMSVPIIFKPTVIGGRTLVDGGLVEPVPVTTVRNMGADIVIAVNLDAHHLVLSKNDKLDNLYSVSQQLLNLTRVNLANRDTAKADVVASPDSKIKSIIGWLEFFNARRIISDGEAAMEEQMPKLKKLLKA